MSGQHKERMVAVVRFVAAGFHRWPDAPGVRGYLASLHRHLFHVEVRLEVHHDAREVEYHDLLDFCTRAFPGGNMEGASCETMARDLAQRLTDTYPGRNLQVSVFEDGEVGAVFEITKEE